MPPSIVYNTSAHQERDKRWKGNKFLDSMRHERVVDEIDRAHKMGIEVFVINTEWFEKTEVEVVPDGRAKIRVRDNAPGAVIVFFGAE